jgi:hypothetical protein
MQIVKSDSACAFVVVLSFVIPSDVSQIAGSEGECSRWMSCDGDGRRVVVNRQDSRVDLLDKSSFRLW